ncbi:MAG: hypothetical protein Tsb002_02190 [Wenzhouxiangellaceae bacterium]
MNSKLYWCVLALAAVLALSGCAGDGGQRDGSPSNDDGAAAASASGVGDTLEDRAMARWNALIKRDYAAAYPYYTPGYRLTTPLLQFIDNFPGGRVIWSEAQYVDEECTDVRCIVRLDLTYSFLNPVPGVDSVVNTRLIKETWVLLDGVWYFSP